MEPLWGLSGEEGRRRPTVVSDLPLPDTFLLSYYLGSLPSVMGVMGGRGVEGGGGGGAQNWREMKTQLISYLHCQQGQST